MQPIKLNLLTMPVWWYSAGLGIVWAWMKRQYRYGLSRTGLLLFARHIREPLFGDYTKSGIVVGFFLRLALLAIKLMLFLLRLIWLAAVLLIYLCLPPACIAMIIYQLAP